MTSRFAAAAAHPAVVAAGLEVLGAGGNAVDAAVAAAFTAFVVEPVSAGLGGYGRLSAYDAATGRFRTVNHGPRAPLAATPDMFTPGELTGDDFWPDVEGRANEVGARAVAVPGAVTGLAQAHAQGGRLRFADLLEPAIAEAERGIEVTWRIILPVARHLAAIRRLPAAASYLLDGGDPPEPTAVTGRRLDGSALAQTLRRIQSGGPGAFTTGEVAAAIARQVQAQGGLLTAADLAGYRPKTLAEEPATEAGGTSRGTTTWATRPCRFSRAWTRPGGTPAAPSIITAWPVRWPRHLSTAQPGTGTPITSPARTRGCAVRSSPRRGERRSSGPLGRPRPVIRGGTKPAVRRPG